MRRPARVAMRHLTVWESIDALADFTYRTGHGEFLRRRREFFEAPTEPILCLWWIPEGTIPTVADAIARVAHLPRPRSHSPDDETVRLGSAQDTCPA